ncbi:phage tail fiber protein [Streptomyces flavofungini]|uniref:phage tail fiber protein n=1 Tax=Streptomyces flavofungini TaxID=68200 RepID=UPI0034E03315
MTAGLAPSLVSGWLNTLRTAGAAYGPVAGTFAQLHTGDPGAAGTANASAGSTARNSFTFAASASGSALALSSAPAAWTNGGTSETLTHISVWTASSAGTLLFSVALNTNKPWASADTFNLTTLTVSLTPQAA